MLAKRWVVGCILLFTAAAQVASACPFCESPGPSWSRAVREADAAVIARATYVSGIRGNDGNPLVRVRWEVRETLAGEIAPGKTFHVEMPDPPQVGDQWLLTGVGAGDVRWTPVQAVDAQRANYLRAALKLPATDAARWKFFYAYLEHRDEALANDAYCEFAAAPFAELRECRAVLNREELWRWIENEKTPASRRGLYYTLLGICGDERDAARTAALLARPDKRPPGGLDALTACYLALTGEEGLRHIEKAFLANPKAPADDVLAMIGALRFHGEERHAFTPERIAAAYGALLDRPALAAPVIADLARWQQWQHAGALARLFKTADKDEQWIRVPIVAYLQACPLPAAARHLEELAKLDPEAIELAETLALYGAKLGPKK
jgi:hypothetical protein